MSAVDLSASLLHGKPKGNTAVSDDLLYKESSDLQSLTPYNEVNYLPNIFICPRSHGKKYK